MKYGLTLAIWVAVAFLAVSSTGLAAKGGGGGGSSLELVVLTSLSLGGEVTFNVSTTRTDEPWVNVRCYQGETLVYGQTHGFFPGYRWGQVFTLGPTQLWTSGDARCVARLYSVGGKDGHTLATASFNVS